MDKQYQDLLAKIPEKEKTKLENAHKKLETARQAKKKTEADQALAEIKTMLETISVEGAEKDALQKLSDAYVAEATKIIGTIKSEVETVAQEVNKNRETTVVSPTKTTSFWPSWLSFLGSGPEETVDTSPMSQQVDDGVVSDVANAIETLLNEGKSLLDTAISGVSSWRTGVIDFFSFTDNPKDATTSSNSSPDQQDTPPVS